MPGTPGTGRTSGISIRAVAAAAVVALSFGTPTVPGAAAASPDRAQGDQRPDFTLTVLHNNDAESQLLGTPGDVDGDGTIGADEERAFGNVARFGTVVNHLRNQAQRGRPPEGHARRRAALLVSSGDNFLAGPEFSASLEQGVPYYDALAMSALDYDASVLGNHEFDFGPEVAANFIQSFGGGTPFVSANLDFSEEPRLAELVERGWLSARTVVRKRGERIGIIGLTTPELRSVSSPRDVEISDELARITTKHVQALQRRGTDKIVLLSHLQDIDNEVELAGKLSGVDVIVGGGGGELLADADDRLIPGDSPDRGYPIVATDSTGADVPVVTTSGAYNYVGKLAVHFEDGKVTGWDDAASGPVRVSGVGPDAVEPNQTIETRVVEPVHKHVNDLDQTVVAQSEVALDGERGHVRKRETNLGDLLADALRWEARQQASQYGVPETDVAIQNGGGIRNESTIPAGPVTALDTYDIAPFPNFVAVMPEVPPKTFKRLLERMVAAAPDTAGQFGQVSGFSFTYDSTAQAQQVNGNSCEITRPGRRVKDVTLDDGTVIVKNGEVVAQEPIVLATNDFSARGGDCYPLDQLDFTSVGKTYQQALEEYLTEGLGGQVTAAGYPEGGEGRITRTG